MTTDNQPYLDPFLSHLMATAATDLHLAAGSVPRVRIDGRLVAIHGQPESAADLLDQIIADLLTKIDQTRLEEERQLDFSFAWQDPNNAEINARFRGNIYFQMDKPALALRLIPTLVPTPQDLGLPEATAALAKRPHGLVLMTGPTGSGKSTTQAAIIGWINRNRPVHILTIEDPIEYAHDSDMALVNQREIGSDATTFAEALRSALREDPDVVLVGEMRDLETIQLALTLAETGHLVFGTVHTNDAAQTVDRIVDTFPAPQQQQVRTQFSMTLAAVVSQRLIPKIGGGRVAAFEVLMGTNAVSNLIREGQVRQIRNAIVTGAADGMQVLETSLNELVSNGVVTYEEAVAASVYPDEIDRPKPTPVLGPEGQQLIHANGQFIFELPGVGQVDQNGFPLPTPPQALPEPAPADSMSTQPPG